MLGNRLRWFGHVERLTVKDAEVRAAKERVQPKQPNLAFLKTKKESKI